MHFLPIKTRKFIPPKDDLFELLDKHLPKLKEGDVLLITSKILAIHQGRCIKVKVGDLPEKDKLIMKEAEQYIPRNQVPGQYAILTIKYHTLIPSAGIDRSNALDYYILWPKNINQAAKTFCKYLQKKHKIKKLAVIITDSHTIPLRRGTMGVSIGFYGLKPVNDLRGKPDVFGQKLKITQTDTVDALTAAGVMLMGESNEQTPLLIIRGATFVKFTSRNTYRDLVMHPKTDLYAPLFKAFKRKKK
ncbi:MAG: coenzyme F420-0:L-glutamate ligase [Candidatus Doudnabacteria bacterium]|nr:coenzyme F420-0:L-glutamate ligase [Candidatus Doudnabacteria bacterium]